MSESKKTTRKDDPMDVDALSKGKSKGKGKKGSSGKGKGSKGQNHMNKCWNCGKTGHHARNCSEWWWSRGKGVDRYTSHVIFLMHFYTQSDVHITLHGSRRATQRVCARASFHLHAHDVCLISLVSLYWFTSSLPHSTCTLPSTSSPMSTASRELTAAPSHNEEYCTMAIYHPLTKGKGRSETGGQDYEHADGWTWSGEQSDAWWKTTDWQRGTGSGWWTTANDWTPWESEEPMGGIEFNSIERCCSLEGAQNKE